MGRVIFVAGQLRANSFHQAREDGAKVELRIGRPDSAKIIETPNHTSGAKIETGMTVPNSFVERVRGPEALGVEMFNPVGNDVLDCRSDVAIAPADGP